MSDETISSYRRLDEPSRPIAGLSVSALAAAAAIITLAFALLKLGAPFRAVFTLTLVVGGPIFLAAAIGTGTVSIVRELRAAITAIVRPGDWTIRESRQGLYLTDLPDHDKEAER